MATSLRNSQTQALLRLLELNKSPTTTTWHEPWKVLVYDAFCRDLISTLLKKGDLRKCGITLYLLLDSDREQISDVPAVYFMQPTQANIKRLGADCARALYESYHVNFTPAVPRPLLEELAATTLESECVSQIARVVDQYLNFVSLEEHFFSLQLPRSYHRLSPPCMHTSVAPRSHASADRRDTSASSTSYAVPLACLLPLEKAQKAQLCAHRLV